MTGQICVPRNELLVSLTHFRPESGRFFHYAFGWKAIAFWVNRRFGYAEIFPLNFPNSPAIVRRTHCTIVRCTAQHNQSCCIKFVKWFYPNFAIFWPVSRQIPWVAPRPFIFLMTGLRRAHVLTKPASVSAPDSGRTVGRSAGRPSARPPRRR